MTAEDPAFDPDALRRRYLEERERRLRPEGIEQYVWVEGDRAGFADDIYMQEPIERPPLTDELDVALIGAGFGGLLLGAHLRKLGVLILATGFEMGTDYSKRAGFPIVGVDGLSLSEAWSDGVRTFHGLYLEGFPNLTMVSIAQSGFTTNFVYLLEVQARHGAWTIATALDRDIERLEASPTAVADWVDAVMERSGRTAEFSANCTPGFYNNEGQVERKTLQAGFYFGGPTEYADILEAWRADGRLDGLEYT